MIQRYGDDKKYKKVTKLKLIRAGEKYDIQKEEIRKDRWILTEASKVIKIWREKYKDTKEEVYQL